jgi:hypothetical protein
MQASLYLDTIRDVYEAYALYQFFMLCVSFLGGEPHTKLVFSRKADQEHLWCVSRSVLNPQARCFI